MAHSNAHLAEQTQPTAIETISEALALLGKEHCSVREMRAKIMGLEEAMRAVPGHYESEDFDTRHHFGPGTYVRELRIAAGTTLTGKIHTGAHLNILAQGVITVWTEDGMKTLQAPMVLPSQAAMKRVGYAHTDTTWITVHANPDNCRDVKKVTDRIAADTFDEAYLRSSRSFDDAIRFLGFSAAEVREASENGADLIPAPEALSPVSILPSPIHGMGVFAARPFAAGDVIVRARVMGKRTPAGRYCNHSGAPNAEMRMDGGANVDLVAVKPIAIGEEILNDYYLDYGRTRVIERQGGKLCLS